MIIETEDDEIDGAMDIDEPPNNSGQFELQGLHTLHSRRG